MMKYYFSLQLKRIFRSIEDFGLPATLGVLIVSVSFLLGSYYIFRVTEFAPLAFGAFGTVTLMKMGGFSRITVLNIFKRHDFLKIRLIENILVSIPFICVFVFESQFLFGLGMFLMALVLSPFQQKSIGNFIIPTPFKKIPFEHIVGFRNTFYMLFVVVFLMYKAIDVANFNLGLFALVIAIVLPMLFFMKTENVFFVWVFSTNPKGFLLRKIKTAIAGYAILTLPFALVLGCFFNAELWFVIGAELAGVFYLIAVVLAKYSAFPKEIHLPQVIFLAISIWVPPLLLVVIPYFYRQSTQKLQTVLQ